MGKNQIKHRYKTEILWQGRCRPDFGKYNFSGNGFSFKCTANENILITISRRTRVKYKIKK